MDPLQERLKTVQFVQLVMRHLAGMHLQPIALGFVLIYKATDRELRAGRAHDLGAFLGRRR
jgi:hypothetical protein